MWIPQLMIKMMMQWAICIRTKISVGDLNTKFGLKNTLKPTTGTRIYIKLLIVVVLE
jgi:hypothetical protein